MKLYRKTLIPFVSILLLPTVCSCSFLINLVYHPNGGGGDSTYTVTFDSKGGSEVASISNIVSGNTITKPDDPTRDHYDFLSWYKDEALTEEFDFSTSIESDLTLYAKWHTHALCLTALEDSSSLNYQNMDLDVTPALKYSLDEGNNWTIFNENEPDLIINKDQKVYIINENETLSETATAQCKFKNSAGTFKVSGELCSMINYANITTDYCFSGLFGGTRIVSVKDIILPDHVFTNCYNNLFSSCSLLKEVMDVLPVTTLASGCYFAMFAGDNSLENAPFLPATDFAGCDDCYEMMFVNALNLTTSGDQKDLIFACPASVSGNESTYFNNMYGYMGPPSTPVAGSSYYFPRS